jgi:hypothetical protein
MMNCHVFVCGVCYNNASFHLHISIALKEGRTVFQFKILRAALLTVRVMPCAGVQLLRHGHLLRAVQVDHCRRQQRQRHLHSSRTSNGVCGAPKQLRPQRQNRPAEDAAADARVWTSCRWRYSSKTSSDFARVRRHVLACLEDADAAHAAVDRFIFLFQIETLNFTSLGIPATATLISSSCCRH